MKKKTQPLYTWEQLSKMEPGTIVRDWFEEGVRCIILRSQASLCAYLGIPLTHPLAEFEYDAIPLRCHYGLTFSEKGNGTYLPDSCYWYGWDYAHSGDYCFYYDQPSVSDMGISRSSDKKWLVEDVATEVWNAAYDLKMLMKLAEAIANKRI